VTISFDAFSTEDCCDFVYLYDGIDTTAPMMIALSGNVSPDSLYTTTQHNMFITFSSDGSVTYNGFIAKYTTTGRLSLHKRPAM